MIKPVRFEKQLPIFRKLLAQDSQIDLTKLNQQLNK